MDPASSNPPVEPVNPVPQEVPAVPPVAPTTPATSVTAATPAPEVPPAPAKTGGSRVMIIVAVVVLVIAVLAALAYFLGYLSLGGSKSQTSTEVVPTVIPAQIPSATESASPVASPSTNTQGTVAGKLCYPSEGAPAGEIIAKETSTKESFTQVFAGTAAGATLAYTFPLAPGTYHLKYQTSPTMAGYYTACAKDPTSTVCAQDTNHVNLDVVVTAGKNTTGIDLCDFYWNQTQKAALDADF